MKEREKKRAIKRQREARAQRWLSFKNKCRRKKKNESVETNEPSKVGEEICDIGGS